jgi:hypothetical protein
MNKVTALLTLGGSAVLLAGCTLLPWLSGGKDQGTGGQGASQGQGPFNGTLQAAVKLGIPMKCTYTVEGMEAEGWIKGQQYRGKMKNQQGQVGEVLMKDNCMWTWDETKGQGVKMCFDPEENQDLWDPQTWDETETEGTQPPDVDYHCNPAVVTEAQFQPPANIEFMDLDQMMQGLKEGAAPNQEQLDQMQNKVNQMMDYGEGE